MKCPNCNATDSRVLDSRPVEDGASIKRRRECVACGKRFTTYEMIETAPIMVVKKDGRREPFDRHKLESGIRRASEKRNVDVSAIVTDVESELINSMAPEVSSSALGEMVMERLHRLDEVAYIRFASVYREFCDVDSFYDELERLLRERRGRSEEVRAK